MTLLPDVPVVVVVVHLSALAVLVARTVISKQQRLALLRENRIDLSDTF